MAGQGCDDNKLLFFQSRNYSIPTMLLLIFFVFYDFEFLPRFPWHNGNCFAGLGEKKYFFIFYVSSFSSNRSSFSSMKRTCVRENIMAENSVLTNLLQIVVVVASFSFAFAIKKSQKRKVSINVRG